MKRTIKKKKSKLKLIVSEKGDRRYPVGKFPGYDAEYEKRVRESVILNDHKRERDMINAGALHSLHACRMTLLQLTGIESGENKGYYLGIYDTWYQGHIPASLEKLKSVWAEFRIWQKIEVRAGRSLELPKTWNPSLLGKRLTAEAILDVYLREKAKTEKLIEHFAVEERKIEILPPFTTASEAPANGEWLVDGQHVSVDAKGRPYIDEPSSKYNRMPLFYYFKMAAKWKTDVQLLGRQEAEKMIRKMEADPTRKIPPTKMQKHKLLNHFWSEMKFTEDELPDWPAEAKPIDELK